MANINIAKPYEENEKKTLKEASKGCDYLINLLISFIIFCLVGTCLHISMLEEVMVFEATQQ